jgi:hypothetical protein
MNAIHDFILRYFINLLEKWEKNVVSEQEIKKYL